MKYKIPTDDYVIFCQAARYKSMKKTSEILDLPISTISRRIASLEENLNIQLFTRNKNGLTLTNDGLRYNETLKSVLEELELKINQLSTESEGIVGKVTLSSSRVFYMSYIHSIVMMLLRENPRLEIEVVSSTKSSKLGDNIDIAIVSGELPESNLIAKRLITEEVGFFASENFIQRYGERLDNHNINVWPYLATTIHPKLTIVGATKDPVHFKPYTKLTTTDIAMLVDSLKEGIGFGVLPKKFAHNESGLIELKTELSIKPVSFSILYRNRERQSASLKRLLKKISESFN